MPFMYYTPVISMACRYASEPRIQFTEIFFPLISTLQLLRFFTASSLSSMEPWGVLRYSMFSSDLLSTVPVTVTADEESIVTEEGSFFSPVRMVACRYASVPR